MASGRFAVGSKRANERDSFLEAQQARQPIDDHRSGLVLQPAECGSKSGGDEHLCL
jgi:hypothetical protein